MSAADLSPLRSRPRAAALGALVVVFLCALIAVLAARAADDGNLVLLQTSQLTRIGAPVTALLTDIFAAIVMGAAVVAGWITTEPRAQRHALMIAAIAAAGWTLAQGAALIFSYSLATGQSLGSDRFGSDMGVYLESDLGVWTVSGVVLAAVATTVALLVSGTGGARVLAVLAVVTVVTKAMTGHSSTSPDHEAATSTMLIHLLGVSIWVGALLVLMLIPQRGRDLAGEIRRYSTLALICWIALTLAGIWALVTRMTGPSDLLTSTYVQLAVVKTVVLLGLGIIGWCQRNNLAGAFRSGVLYRLALVELVLMALAIALGAAMSSSPPPTTDATPALGPAAVLTGYPLPPAPVMPEVLAAWRFDPLWLAIPAVIVLLWIYRRRRGGRVGAVTALLGAVTLLILVTNGPLNVYRAVLFSAHLWVHLGLFMAGALLAVALPSNLGIPARILQASGTRGLLARAILAASGSLLLVAMYASPVLLRHALDSHAMHVVMQLLAVTAGYIGILAVRGAWAARAADRGVLEDGSREAPATSAQAGATGIVLESAIVVGAWLAPLVALMATLTAGSVVLVPSWFGATGRTWRADALLDQQQGAGGGLLLVLVVAAVWMVGSVVAARRAATTESGK